MTCVYESARSIFFFFGPLFLLHVCDRYEGGSIKTICGAKGCMGRGAEGKTIGVCDVLIRGRKS